MKKLLIAAFALSTLVPGHIQPAMAFSHNKLPACEEQKVLNKIVSRFNQTERIYWEERGFSLSSVTDPHLHAHNPSKGLEINRNYCHGYANFADGSKRRIHYLLEEGAGFAGFTWNVEYCIHGLDPWRYYDGRCRSLSPIHGGNFSN